MRIEQLKYLIYVAECGSFNRAGEKYFISPQSIYASIKKLEDTIGSPLIQASGKGVEFTDAGMVVLDFAKTTLREYDNMLHTIRLQEEVLCENLTIYTVLLFEELLNKNLELWVKHFPYILVSVFFDDSKTILNKISENESENIVGIIALDKATYENTKETFDYNFIGYGKLYYCTRKDSHISKYKCVTADKLLQEPLIILRSNDAALDTSTILALEKMGNPKIQGYAASFKIFANFILRYDCVGVYADFKNEDQRIIDIEKYAGLKLLNYESGDDRVFCYITSKNCSETVKKAIKNLIK